jgi:hypothetical protein
MKNDFFYYLKLYYLKIEFLKSLLLLIEQPKKLKKIFFFNFKKKF